jgi:hypothetical protein
MAKVQATSRRRNYEYDHHYGLGLAASSKTRQRVVSSRGKPPRPAQKVKATRAAKKR